MPCRKKGCGLSTAGRIDIPDPEGPEKIKRGHPGIGTALMFFSAKAKLFS